MKNSMVMLTFCFRAEISFLGKFSPRNSNCYFKLKFGTNLNMHNSMVILIFSDLDRKYRVWANLVQKIKIAILS